MSAILVTGGAGYIGAHTLRELIAAGRTIFVLDNLAQGHQSAIPLHQVNFIKGDIGDAALVKEVITRNHIETVLHFAGYAYVGESIARPLDYYANNVMASLNLLNVMKESGCHKIVFSSSCATYGEPAYLPIDEKHPQNPINPYGTTKFLFEKALKDYYRAYGLKSVILRYFNACGASEDGLIGEDHRPEPHLIPLVLEAAKDAKRVIRILGNDYTTPDGTCIRDYIHVKDLALAHVQALNYLECGGDTIALNLGTGSGVSVEEIIRISEKVTGKSIAREYHPRRSGDPACLVATSTLAENILHWKPAYDISYSIKTAWQWMTGPNQGRFKD